MDGNKAAQARRDLGRLLEKFIALPESDGDGSFTVNFDQHRFQDVEWRRDFDKPESPFTWGDVHFLRREAGRHERWSHKNGDAETVAGNLRKAAQLRSLADRIEHALRERAA